LTGITASEKVSNGMLSAKELGKAAMEEFMSGCFGEGENKMLF